MRELLGSGVWRSNSGNIIKLAASFSTGCGLGLAIVHNTVQEHHGRISVSSHPGKGTTFRVDLPVVEQV